MGTYCGSDEFYIRSSSHAIRIEFRSDHINVYSGFVLSWKRKFSLFLCLENALKTKK